MDARQTRTGGRFLARDRGSEDAPEPEDSPAAILRVPGSHHRYPMIDLLSQESIAALLAFVQAPANGRIM